MKSRTWLLLACFSCLPYIQSCTDDLPAPTLPHICGNGVVEPGETCDDYNTDSGDGCSGKCQVETGWVCKNEGKPCTKPGDPANDAICGDGELSDGEDCDDANTTSGDGCSDTCRIEPDWECKTPGEPCTKSDPAGPGNDDTCGDKSLSNDEECDDGNTNDGDGCSKNCTIEEGWKCETPGKQCTELPKTPICGDKIISENETCDDGNVINGDGCSDKCQIEEGWTCTSSGCTQLPPPNVCGDSKITGDEKCDDGNTKNGDGCSDKCQIESGWECDDKGCHKIQTAACGDSKLSAGEECDDGNTKNGDGCSSKCVIEDGYACPTAGTACKIEYDSKTSIKILGIGNSFMRDATCYLTDILLDMGYKNVTVGVLYSGGRSINDHADNIRKGNTALKYFYNVNGTEKNSNNPVYIDKIKSEAWDYVVLQQYPSGVVDLYNEDLDYVIKTIQNNATSKPKIMWAMTWAFQTGSPHTHLYYHGHNQMKMYEMTVNAIQSKILTNKNIAEVIPAGTAVQNMRSGIMGDNMNRDGYHMSMNNGRFVTALTWAKQITKRPISGVTFTPAGHAYADMKLSLKYTKRQIDAIKEAVLNAYKHPYEVTVPAKGVDADYSALKKPLHDIFKNNKYDLSKYRELKFGATEQAYYNPTTRYAGICTLASAKPAVSENGTDVKYCYSTMVTAENGGTSATLKKYAATRIFNRHEIPNGSVIVMKDGYQYIPDGWTDLKEMTPSEKRPKTVKTQIVEVNDAWWGNFNYRAFSIAKAGSPELTDKEMAELPGAITIFVPTHLDNTDNAEDVFVKKGYDMSKYTKLDLGVAFKAYYNSNTASDLPGLVYGTIKASHKFPAKLFDGNATAKKYAATKIFRKSEIPNGSVIVAVKGYQYYQDGWSELDVPNLNGTRPAVVQAKDSDSIVTVNDAWWGKFKYRGFDIGRVKSPDEPTPLEQSMLADKFAIFVPKK